MNQSVKISTLFYITLKTLQQIIPSNCIVTLLFVYHPISKQLYTNCYTYSTKLHYLQIKTTIKILHLFQNICEFEP